MTVPTTSSEPSLSTRMQAALNLPAGARFYRCALQVNPFAYIQTHKKQTSFQSEDDYNAAIIKTCREKGIEVIGVADHYRVKQSVSLVKAARAADLYAFNGFEAITTDGVHFVCLFNSDKNDEDLERIIGECRDNTNQVSPIGSLDSKDLLKRSKRWPAACFAAHVASKGGLLKQLSGQARARVWKSENLLACALPGPVREAPSQFKSILENKDSEHRRAHALAIINASDVNGPEDLRKDSASCFIKMSKVSVEAFRQAFFDPESRIRLHSDPEPEPHAKFLAMTWKGGFLDNTSVHLNGELNVLVGGRGTGKSTVIESMRYALGLDPLSEEASKAHKDVIQNVLRSGTKVSLLVQTYKPSEDQYIIERTVPNPTTVKDKTGNVLRLLPCDVMPGVEVFGQHEISELTKNPEKLTLLLERFADRDPSLSGRKANLRLDLEKSRSRILNVLREMETLDERLAALPALEEMVKRFQKAGLEKRLKEKNLLIREEGLFLNIRERLEPIHLLHSKLVEDLPIDTAFVSAKALEGLPNADILAETEKILGTFSMHLKDVGDQLAEALSEANRAITDTKSRWSEQSKAIEETYERLLRELQKSKIDGAEFIRLQKQIEELRPLKNRMENLKRSLTTHEAHRRNLLSEWEDFKTQEYRKIEGAAKKVSKKLRDRVRVEVAMDGNRDPLEQLLREVGGHLTPTLERFRSLGQLSLRELAQRCREGKQSLIDKYNLPPKAAERIAQAGPDLCMRIEELELPLTTKIELNTAAEGNKTQEWKTLEALSTGQKATAVLLLLLLESEAPLVVDQPEDDLDNRFITESVVPILRQEKRRRQFVFSTHNANIPVLGDAELILGLSASGEAKEGHASIASEHMGSIDSKPVRELVEKILEGSKNAFETRRFKYGF